MNWVLASIAAAVVGLAIWLAPPDSASVIDGDTLRIAGRTVRLFAIDIPDAGQPGAVEAKANLERLIEGKTVNCSKVNRDQYDRDVSLCTAGGVDLSAAQIRFGHAVVWCSYVRKNRPGLLASLRDAETQAKREHRGLWARPMEPWRDWGC